MYDTIMFRRFRDEHFFPMIHNMYYGGEIVIFDLEYSSFCCFFLI